MPQPSNETCWTGVILAYTCPNCGKSDRQRFVLEGGSYDQSVIRKAADRMTPCRACGKPLPKNLPLGTDIVVATLEQLRNAGYPVPPVN
jgi:hypothetical protein